MSAWREAAHHGSPVSAHEATVIRAFLARVSRRVRILAAAEGAAIGLAAALVVSIIATLVVGADGAAMAIALAAALAGALIGAAVAASGTEAAPPLIERRAPQSRNIVWTAAELIDEPGRVPPHVGARVCADAVRVIRSLDPRALFPARRALLALGAASLAWSLAVAGALLLPRALPASAAAAREVAGPPSIARIDVTVTPPAYVGGSPRSLADPGRIEALAGSTVRLQVHAHAASVAIETVVARDTLGREGEAFVGVIAVDADGYIAIEAAAADGRVARRLIGLTALPDLSPVVRITAPGRDLAVPDGDRSVEVAVEAGDDIGLAALALTFTRVSGSGEQHTFTHGDVPLAITRDGATAWRARGTLRLDTLRLMPGDMVVYRAAARDRRPGAAPAESDAFIVEVASPGDIAMEGFSSDEEERYALSQQMVLVKTERLIARAPSLTRDSLAQEAMLIAAEQRAVRAEFVFMMGGELEDDILPEASMDDLNEEAHAELDDEAIAGRLRNRGRADLLSAIRAMSRANTALLAADLDRARAEERTAIDLLQQAFSRTRYILRALTQRERLDLDRRLTGDLGGLGRNAWPSPEPAARPRLVALRRALADVAGLAGTPAETRADSAAAAALAVLRVDPSSEPLRLIANDLDAAAAALGAGRSDDAQALLDGAALALAGHVRTELGRGTSPPPSLLSSRLRGALSDALRGNRP